MVLQRRQLLRVGQPNSWASRLYHAICVAVHGIVIQDYGCDGLLDPRGNVNLDGPDESSPLDDGGVEKKDWNMIRLLVLYKPNPYRMAGWN